MEVPSFKNQEKFILPFFLSVSTCQNIFYLLFNLKLSREQEYLWGKYRPSVVPGGPVLRTP